MFTFKLCIHPQKLNQFAPIVHLLLSPLILLWFSKLDIIMFHGALFNIK